MSNGLFILVLAALSGGLLLWGFRALTGERWQILATLPVLKGPNGDWRGVNITYYGFFTATALVAAACLMVVLMGSLDMGMVQVVVVLGPLISLCVPAARMVARVVEHKAYTFTVAGAFFVGMLVAPWLVVAADWALGGRGGVPLMGACAAMAIAYAFGEGLGRLACISFGCCYGKPLDQAPGWLKALLAGRGFVFAGATKKAAYQGHLEGQPLVPIQAITATLYLLCALASLYLFMAGLFGWAVMVAVSVTQIWRVLSEFMRADFRGGGRLTAYQYMCLIAVAYAGIMVWLAPAQPPITPQAALGLELLWGPWMLLAMQAVWVAILLYTGRSRVTSSTISFHVMQDRV